jgi:hypothetical protein
MLLMVQCLFALFFVFAVPFLGAGFSVAPMIFAIKLEKHL